MAIDPADLVGIDAAMAARVIAVARSIAPCLDSLVDADRTLAIGILTSVASEATARGMRGVKSQRIGPAAVEYFSATSWFADDDRAALRGLCPAVAVPGTPIGEFPTPGIIDRVWPEQTDT